MAVTAQFAIIAGGVLNPPRRPRFLGSTPSPARRCTPAAENTTYTEAHPMSGRYPASRGRRPASWAPEPPPSSWQSPVFARWADELHVFQRTPSSVDERDQRRTNPQEWRQMTLTKGWWRARNENWCGRQATPWSTMRYRTDGANPRPDVQTPHRPAGSTSRTPRSRYQSSSARP
ncbi:hypothetical protein MHUMG1_00086 [Metarhizium humberi]|uniref:Uncharacterized protein n=1 Tax=Metarhizium humberi TaxID=2596975 RepID=A0A9P8SAW9_9HYPO|nr:hypothetical protein MHUMG1_00086 [Metarhizium humberi]